MFESQMIDTPQLQLDFLGIPELVVLLSEERAPGSSRVQVLISGPQGDAVDQQVDR